MGMAMLNSKDENSMDQPYVNIEYVYDTAAVNCTRNQHAWIQLSNNGNMNCRE
jgi:hypothetical protein